MDAKLYLPGSFFRERDEFFQIGRRKFRAHQQDLVADRHHRDRREILFPVVWHLLVQRCGNGGRAVGREIDRVTVRIGMSRSLGADQPARAGLVLDHDLLAPHL
jgi:hypothetical protein